MIRRMMPGIRLLLRQEKVLQVRLFFLLIFVDPSLLAVRMVPFGWLCSNPQKCRAARGCYEGDSEEEVHPKQGAGLQSGAVPGDYHCLHPPVLLTPTTVLSFCFLAHLHARLG